MRNVGSWRNLGIRCCCFGKTGFDCFGRWEQGGEGDMLKKKFSNEI